jgi:deoxyribodipyrimidine photo-lyase
MMNIQKRLYALPSTRAAALAQFTHFLPNVKNYARARNFVTVAHQNVARISPATRHCLVTQAELAQQVLDMYALADAEKLLQEIYWRTYFKGNLEQHPLVWVQWRDVYSMSLKNPLMVNLETRRKIDAIENGACPVDVINYFARELVEHGYLHNHARMWFAAYWIHVARLPWELGAAFFYRHLLDGDPASNTLSWRWVAGLHTPGKAYLARASNIQKYCERAALGVLTSLRVLGDDVVQAHIPPDRADRRVFPLLDYPTTLTSVIKTAPNTARVGLWIHADDLSVEVLLTISENVEFLHSSQWVAVLYATPASLCDDYRLSPLRRQHIATAQNDAVSRMKAIACGERGRVIEEDHSTDLSAALISFAQRNGLTHIVAMKPLVGELADAASTLEQTLANIGVAIRWLRRTDDALLFPVARSGFFGFWQRASEQLSARALHKHKPEQQASFGF